MNAKAQQQLLIGGRPYLRLTQGEGFKGKYYCSDRRRNRFLPGNRYFLFEAQRCGNYDGQLLLDTLSGQYKRLPSQTAVYLRFNTDTDPHYRITPYGIHPDRYQSHQ